MSKLSALAGVVAFVAFEARGVESLRLAERFAVIGIISEDVPGKSPLGIVVLRDRVTKKTVTARSGALLVGYDRIKVERVRRKHVVLSDGLNRAELDYASLDRDVEQAPLQVETSSNAAAAARKELWSPPAGEAIVTKAPDSFNSKAELEPKPLFLSGGEELIEVPLDDGDSDPREWILPHGAEMD